MPRIYKRKVPYKGYSQRYIPTSYNARTRFTKGSVTKYSKRRTAKYTKRNLISKQRRELQLVKRTIRSISEDKAVEKKYLDRFLQNVNPAIDGTVINMMANIPTGTGVNDRIGNEITLTKIMYRMTLRSVPTGDPLAGRDLLRILIILNRETQGEELTWFNVSETGNFQSFNDLNMTKQYTVLKEHIVAINSGYWESNTDETGATVTDHQAFVDVNLPIQYDDPSGSFEDMPDNSVWLVLISQNGSTIIDVNTRVRYTDA